MPTTFTSLLGLSLPATGELAGTWGDTVNNGITSLLDNAIAGTTTLSTDANVTLTTSTGAANQARQAILLCTGARTAQRTITAPAASKTYVVINATTGGFAVQLVGAGPTTGITVVSGERALVAWNGSDFVKIASNLVTGTATRIPFFDASGLLSSAADFVRDASGNVGIGRTPTGSAVVDVQSAAAGILRIRGGTGTNQGSSVYGTVGSDTTTWAIGSRATIYGGTPGNDTAVYSLGTLALGTNGIAERMLIDISGNVGIGATPSSWNSVWSAVDIGPYGSVASERTAASQLVLGWNVYGTGVSSYAYRRTGDVSRLFVMDTSGFYWSTAPSGTAGNAITFTERMRIDSSGNVGIGRVASGGLRLDVAGGGRVAELVLENAGSAGTLGTSPGLYSPASGQLAISTNAAERLRIDSSGNVGIGTASPITRLHVGAVSPSNGVTAILGSTGSTGTQLQITQSGIQDWTIGQPAGVDAFAIWRGRNTSAVGTEAMRITATGNIVAGASAALATTASDGFLYVPTCAGTPTGTPTAITGMAPIVVNTTNNKLYFYSGGAWRDAGP